MSVAGLTETDTGPLSHALERIGSAEVQRDPFPHLIVEGLFPDAFFRSLLAHFPERDLFQRVEYPGTGHGRTETAYHDYGLACRDLAAHPMLRDVDRLFRSDEFSRALLGKFGHQLPDGFWPIPPEKHRYFADGAADFTSVFDLQIDLPGYEIPPHPDVPSKIVTYQLFLSEDDSLREYGTLFCRLKGGSATLRDGRLARSLGSLVTGLAERLNARGSRPYRRLERSALGLSLGIGDNRSWLPWSRVDVVKTVPASANCFMAFPPNAISYHAVRFAPPSTRKQERPVIRGFIRAGRNTRNWIQARGM